MSHTWILSATTAVLLPLAAPTPATAQPPPTHALVHLHNQSTAPCTVYYRWGNAPWRSFVIREGNRGWMSFTYDGQSQSSPDLMIRIDVDTNGSKFMEHKVTRGASPDDNSVKYGHHFAIKQLQGTDTRYIQALTPGARVLVTDKNSSRP